MKKLAVTAGGLGNQIQMTAAIRTLESQLGWEVEMLTGGAPVAAAEMRDWMPWPTHRPAWRPEDGEFDGAVALGFGANNQEQNRGWCGIPWLNDISTQAVRTARSEVDVSMDACRDLGIAEADLNWHGLLNANDAYRERFDVVLANNYYKGTQERPNDTWHVKGFPGFASVAREIQTRWPRLSVCCIGVDARERIQGVTDRTGLPLGDALALIKRAKFLVTTDSMAFHAAACFDTQTFALFTATSQTKCACPKFHASATVIAREDLACRDKCYSGGCLWHKCKRWECQEIGVSHIVDTIANLTGGGA